MGYWEGHAIMTPTLSRLFGVLLACAVALHSIWHKNFMECIVLFSLIVAIHTSAYLVSRYIERTKDTIKSVFRSFKRPHYIYVDNLNNCIILNNKGKLTKAQFNGEELENIEFTTDNSLLESFKKKIKSFDTSDILAYKSGRLLCKDCEVYSDIAYVDNAVTLNKLKALRESLLSNTGGLSTLGRDVDTRPEDYTDSTGDVEILVTLTLYSILYLCLVVIGILGFI